MFVGKIKLKDKDNNVYIVSVYSSQIKTTCLQDQYSSNDEGMYDFIFEDGTYLSVDHKTGTLTNVHGTVLEAVDYL